MNHPLYRAYLRELLLRGVTFLAGLGVVLVLFLEIFTFPVEGALGIGMIHLFLGLLALGMEARFRVFLRRMAEQDPRWADLLATFQEFQHAPPPPLFRRELDRLMGELPPPPRVLSPLHRTLGVVLAGALVAGVLAHPARFQDDLLFSSERLEVVPAPALEGERVEIRRTPPERVPVFVGRRRLDPTFRKGQAVYVFLPPGPGTYEIRGRTTRQTLQVLPRPPLDQVLLLAHPPAYTGFSPSTHQAGHRVVLPEGTSLSVVVQVTDTLWNRLELQAKTLHVLHCPCVDTLFLGLLTADSLEIRWTLQGPRTFTAPPLQVITLRDRPPRLSLSPSLARADQMDTLIVHLLAVDDFGLENLSMREFGPWGTRSSRKGLARSTEWEGRDTLLLSTVALLPGDTLFRIYTVRDIAGKRSPPETLRIVYPDLADLAELPDTGDLSVPEEELSRAKERFRRIREEILSRREVTPSTREAMESLLERQEEVLRSMEQRARQLSEALEHIRRMQNLDPRLVQELQQVASLLSETMTRELQEALENLRRQMGEKTSPEAMNRALEALEKAQEETLQRLQAFKALLQELKTLKDMEALAQDLQKLRDQEFQVESRTLGDTPLRELHDQQAEITRQAARMKERLPSHLKESMDRALKAMEQAQTAMRQGDRREANIRTRKAREELEAMKKTLEQEMQARSGELADLTRKALEEARWRLLGFVSFRGETTRVAVPVLEGVVREVRESSPLLFFAAFRVWQALAQATADLERGDVVAARRLLHLAILGLFDVQNQMAQQSAQGAESLEQMVQQLLQGLRQSQQAMEGMMPLPVPVPREGQGTLEALMREMEALRQQAEALREELGEGSPARDALGELSRTLDENLRKLREGTLSRTDVERQKRATEKFLQAMRAVHRKGFRERRRSTPGKPFTPVPPERNALDPLYEVLRRQALNPNLPPAVRELYRRLYETWTVPSS